MKQFKDADWFDKCAGIAVLCLGLSLLALVTLVAMGIIKIK